MPLCGDRRRIEPHHDGILAVLRAAQAASCTACHGVAATPKPAGANIGCPANVGRHSLAAI
jgi:hypothetical protein